MPVELLLCFHRETAHLPIVELARQRERLELRAAVDLLALAFDIAFVFRLDLDFLGHVRRHGRAWRDIRIVDSWPPQDLYGRPLFQRASAYHQTLQPRLFDRNGVALLIERFPAA